MLTFYRYIVTQSYRTVAVLRSRDDPVVVTLSLHLNPLPQDETAFDTLTGSKDSTLINDLVIEFARLGIEYQGLQHPIRQVSLVRKFLLYQDTTRLEFNEDLLFMLRAKVLFPQTMIRESTRRGVSLTSKGSLSNSVLPTTDQLQALRMVRRQCKSAS